LRFGGPEKPGRFSECARDGWNGAGFPAGFPGQWRAPEIIAGVFENRCVRQTVLTLAESRLCHDILNAAAATVARG
jgi:hypothetical protein